MLLSMTGFGEARTHQNNTVFISEIKTVNNRYLKTNIRLPDLYSPLETRVEGFIREYIARGTVNINIQVIKDNSSNVCQLNLPLLKSYISNLDNMLSDLVPEGQTRTPFLFSLGDYLQLPGVIDQTPPDRDDNFLNDSWTLISENIRLAITNLQEMRRREGEAMARNLTENCNLLSGLITQIAELAPSVVENYRTRLSETVGRLMNDNKLPFTPADLVREVAVYADRVDIAEEITRFRSHLAQFDKLMSDNESCGKKLDFLVQEMFREVNTIGSKANAAAITNIVVEMKGIIERIREMIQNVE